MKIGRQHSLIPRLSLCPMNTLNRDTHKLWFGSPWPLTANFKFNFNIQYTGFNQVGPLNA